MENQAAAKKFYKQWWFWTIVVLVLALIGSNNRSSDTQYQIPLTTEVSSGITQQTSTSEQSVPTKPTKKAVTDSSSQPARITPIQATTAPQPTPTPVVAPPPSWHKVTDFNGSGGTNTDTFQIRGSKWRIDWGFAFPSNTESFCQQNGCNFAVQIYQDDGTYTDQFLESGQQPSSGIVYEHTNAGNYYLRVIPGNVSWTLTVEDYY